MGNGRFLIVTILLGLNLLISLFLETKLKTYFGLELVLVLLGIILSALVLGSISRKESWSWPSATVLFAALLGNLVFLFLQTRTFLLFIVGVVLTVVGLATSVLSVPDANGNEHFYDAPVETYGKTNKKARKKARKQKRK
jgi:hypothetical protein